MEVSQLIRYRSAKCLSRRRFWWEFGRCRTLVPCSVTSRPMTSQWRSRDVDDAWRRRRRRQQLNLAVTSSRQRQCCSGLPDRRPTFRDPETPIRPSSYDTAPTYRRLPVQRPSRPASITSVRCRQKSASPVSARTETEIRSTASIGPDKRRPRRTSRQNFTIFPRDLLFRTLFMSLSAIFRRIFHVQFSFAERKTATMRPCYFRIRGTSGRRLLRANKFSRSSVIT